MTAVVVDPNELYRQRLEAARAAAIERVTAERGTPTTEAERRAFDAEVERLVAEWTEGWEGRGLYRDVVGRILGALGRLGRR